MLPQPASVRLEEYVNDFAYDYPAPTAADAESVRDLAGRRRAACSIAAPRCCASASSALNPPPSEKRPANLVFLVDVSGSMQSADKLPLVQRMLRDTLEILAPDRHGVDRHLRRRHAGPPRHPRRVSQSARITTVIDGLNAGGSTAGAAA